MLAVIERTALFGRLTLDAFKHDMIETSVSIGIVIGGLLLGLYLTYKKKWGWLWNNWITTVDHKKIGIMYVIVSTALLFKGLVDVWMMRAQQAFSVGDATGYLTPDHYQQLFTAHAITMILFVVMGFVSALMNFLIPLQIGARDVAFPFINALSFWLWTMGTGLIVVSLGIGNYSGAGWSGYPPLTEMQYMPDVGVDYWIWSIQISGVGTLLSAINFLVTILKMRAPGMTLMKMPLFIWASLNTSLLILFSFPILTGTLAMLSIDRLFDAHFFTADLGGNPMMYINLFWAWGHPEVYIVILPAFGIYSEVVSTYCKKRLFGYTSMVWAMNVISFLAFIVWVHHFFTMGSGPAVNAFFAFMTMVIAVPTGVKVFNWLFTMYKGKIQFSNPMLWFLGFLIIFTAGGMYGVLLGVAPVDFQLHNTLFLVGHFHSMMIGGSLFGLFAGMTYWFPKIFGFKLEEKYGEWAFYFWFFGFLFAFIPTYVLGFMGAPRRIDHYAPETGWQPLFLIALFGAALIMIGCGLQALQLIVSLKNKDKNKDLTGDPWDGRTLEWATKSPPPSYNFACIPEVDSRDAFWEMKQKNQKTECKYENIHMPKNTPLPFFIGGLGFVLSFAIIWQIVWLSVVSFVGILVILMIRLFDDHTEFEIPATEIAIMEKSGEPK